MHGRVRYEQSPHSCFIYTCNVCVNSFGADGDFGPVFADAFRRLSAATFALLAGGQARHLAMAPTSPPRMFRRDLGAISATLSQAISDIPDVIDDYFELCSKILRKCPPLILESGDVFTAAFQCGCAALHIQHREVRQLEY